MKKVVIILIAILLIMFIYIGFENVRMKNNNTPIITLKKTVEVDSDIRIEKYYSIGFTYKRTFVDSINKIAKNEFKLFDLFTIWITLYD